MRLCTGTAGLIFSPIFIFFIFFSCRLIY